LNDYEIMLLLDPELAEERGLEIIQRIRDSVERQRRDPGTATSLWAAAVSPTRSITRARAVYHLLLVSARPRRWPRSRVCSRSPTA